MSDLEVKERCFEVIDDRGKESLESDGFKSLNYDTVNMIISRETLDIKEVDLWLACMEWAREECKRQGKQVGYYIYM